VDGLFRERQTGYGDGSGGGDEDAGNELDGGALARAVGSEEADDLAFVQGEGYVVQYFVAVVAEDDLLELDDGFRQRAGPPGGAIVAWRAGGVPGAAAPSSFLSAFLSAGKGTRIWSPSLKAVL